MINEFRFSPQRIFISNAFTNIIIVKINVNMQITLLYVYLHYTIYICKSGKLFYFEVIGQSGDGSMIDLYFLYQIITNPCQPTNLPYR